MAVGVDLKKLEKQYRQKSKNVFPPLYFPKPSSGLDWSFWCADSDPRTLCLTPLCKRSILKQKCINSWPVVLEPVARSVPWTVIQSRAWERELCWFIWVPKVILFLRAVARIWISNQSISISVIIFLMLNHNSKKLHLCGCLKTNKKKRSKHFFTFLMCWKLFTSMTLRPGTCSCPVPSGLIFMSSFSPSLLSRSLKYKIQVATSTSGSYYLGKALSKEKKEESGTLAPHCRSPQSWLWHCKTTCPSSPQSHWRDVSVLAGWYLGFPQYPGNKKGT